MTPEAAFWKNEKPNFLLVFISMFIRTARYASVGDLPIEKARYFLRLLITGFGIISSYCIRPYSVSLDNVYCIQLYIYFNDLMFSITLYL